MIDFFFKPFTVAISRFFFNPAFLLEPNRIEGFEGRCRTDNLWINQPIFNAPPFYHTSIRSPHVAIPIDFFTKGQRDHKTSGRRASTHRYGVDPPRAASGMFEDCSPHQTPDNGVSQDIRIPRRAYTFSGCLNIASAMYTSLLLSFLCISPFMV